jgi:3-oxoacyl-[acyl-carrier protein] reductase
MSKPLSGKRALVTGGSRGIGAAIVKRLARDGADVAFTYVTKPDQAEETARLARESGARSLAIQADSADADALTAAVDRTVAELGGLDILISNAGIAIMAPVDDFKLADLDRTLAVNLRSVLVAAQAAARHMKAGGRIITIGSCNADRIARDLGARAITVNNVQPGPVDTDMNPATGPFADALKSLMALPRYGQADEIASLVSYLAGPEASYITGASLMIDGGFTA